ncbi:MAG: hypothetical protein VX589_13820 [Myxococcota bacterium]|nr:hypothetical protein [Myxococcota bacterium]
MMRGIIGLIVLIVPTICWALPGIVEVSGENDDATVLLRVERQTILGDSRSFCEIQIVVVEEEKQFTDGDRIYLWVEENDGITSQTVWEFNFEVNGRGRVDETFDCSQVNGEDNPFPSDDGIFVDNRDINLSARARVEKETCGAFCRYDRPQTPSVDVPVVKRDPDDGRDGALGANNPRIPPGTTLGRVARDDDWFQFELDVPSSLRFQTIYRTGYGALDVELFNEQQVSLDNGADNASGNRLESARLPAGTYFIKVGPRVNGAYNFYDVNFSLIGQPGECTEDDDPQRQACGNCGTQTRVCEGDLWSDWGQCSAPEEACTPGESRVSNCGDRCGRRTENCTEACEWVAAGECENEGSCVPGSEVVEICEDGNIQGERSRTCGSDCEFGPFTLCGFCEDGKIEFCFDGPDQICDLQTGDCQGVCVAGVRTCNDGTWSACGPRPGTNGQVLPAATGEQGPLCNNQLDDDCDGLVDGNDDECFVCGNDLLEGENEECDDGANDCDAMCRVVPTQICSPGTYQGGYDSGSFDLFVFSVAEATTMTLQTQSDDACAGMTLIVETDLGVVIQDSEDQCKDIEVLLEPADYTVRIRGDQDLANYTLILTFDNNEMGGSPGNDNPLQCEVQPMAGMPAFDSAGMPSPDSAGANSGAEIGTAGEEMDAGGTPETAGNGSPAAAGKPGSPMGQPTAAGATTTDAMMGGRAMGTGTQPMVPGSPTTGGGRTADTNAMTPGMPSTTVGLPDGDAETGTSGGTGLGEVGSVGASASSGCDCTTGNDANHLNWTLVGLGLLLGVRPRRRRSSGPPAA